MRSVLRLCLAHALLRGADGRPEESHRDVVLVLHGYDAVLPRFDAALETWLRGWTGRVVFVADHALAFHNGTRATIGVLDQVREERSLPPQNVPPLSDF